MRRLREIAMALCLVILILAGVRELRIPLPFGFEWLDFRFDSTTYTLQNVISMWGAILVLVLLVRWDSLKVDDSAPSVSKTNPATSRTRKRRRRAKSPSKDAEATSPFEQANKRWKLVANKERCDA